jgi:hypothetical protein
VRTFSLTITLAPLYYFHTNKFGCHVIKVRQKSVEDDERISGVKNFSKRIEEVKVR